MLQEQRGATILEAIIAMIILALVIIGLNTGVISIIKSNMQSKELTAATTAGYQLFEEFRRDDYDNVVSIGTSIDTVRSLYVRDWKMTIDTIQTQIDLEVRWPATVQNHRIQLSTIIAKP